MSERRNRPLFRLFSLALIPVLLSSCAGWQAQSPPLAPHVEQSPEKVRLTLVGGPVREVDNPTLRNDTIHGFLAQDGSEARYALKDVVQLELSRVDAGKTAKGGLVIAGGVLLVAFLIALNNLSNSFGN